MKGMQHSASLQFMKTSVAQVEGEKNTGLSGSHTRAEIILALHTIEQNHSFTSVNHVVEMLGKIFPDSSIPSKMNMKESKLSYVIVDGIFSFIQNLLKGDLADAPFSLEVDEVNKRGEYLGIIA
jgi:hypothetical protein